MYVQAGTTRNSLTLCILLLLVVFIVSPVQVRAQSELCTTWCANSDTYNTTQSSAGGKDKFWMAWRSYSGFSPTLYVDGLFFSPQPNFTGTPPGGVPGPVTLPGVQYFDQRMVLVLRATDQRIYANTWTGSAWTGWAAAPTPLFNNFAPGVNAKNPAGQTGVLLVVAKDLDGATWWIRSTAIINGFNEGWKRLGCCAPTNVPSLACSNLTEFRIGGKGMDDRCYRRRSVDDAVSFPPPDEVKSPCP